MALSKKEELIKYFIDKMNNNIDLTDIVDEDGKKVFTISNPFQPIIFRKRDKGDVKPELSSNIIKEQLVPSLYIPVSLIGIEIPKTNILPVGENPIENWNGITRLAFLIPIEDVEVYQKVYKKVEEFHETFLFNITEILNIFGKERQISLISSNILDVPSSIQLINSISFKQIQVSIDVNIINKDMIMGKNSIYEIDGNIEQTIGQDVNFSIVSNNTDVSNQNTQVGAIPDSSIRNLALTIAQDKTSVFWNKINDTIIDDGNGNKILQTYSIKNIDKYPDGVELSYTVIYILENWKKNVVDNAPITITLNFRQSR